MRSIVIQITQFIRTINRLIEKIDTINETEEKIHKQLDSIRSCLVLIVENQQNDWVAKINRQRLERLTS